MFKQAIHKSLKAFGYELRKLTSTPVEFEKRDVEIFRYVMDNNLTMVSAARLIATIQACKYAAANGIDGDFVECGVWRGGNAVAAKLIFEAYGSNKKVVLFDTFTGMTAPSAHDKSAGDRISPHDRFSKSKRTSHTAWCYASLEDVKRNVANAGLEVDGVRYVQGDVLETLKDENNLPASISVLRLDTDWYESTKAELDFLYPRVSAGGVLLIDDYGFWDGARKAVDEYFQAMGAGGRPLLHYTDDTGRVAIKPISPRRAMEPHPGRATVSTAFK